MGKDFTNMVRGSVFIGPFAPSKVTYAEVLKLAVDKFARTWPTFDQTRKFCLVDDTGRSLRSLPGQTAPYTVWRHKQWIGADRPYSALAIYLVDTGECDQEFSVVMISHLELFQTSLTSPNT